MNKLIKLHLKINLNLICETCQNHFNLFCGFFKNLINKRLQHYVRQDHASHLNLFYKGSFENYVRITSFWIFFQFFQDIFRKKSKFLLNFPKFKLHQFDDQLIIKLVFKNHICHGYKSQKWHLSWDSDWQSQKLFVFLKFHQLCPQQFQYLFNYSKNFT